MAAPNVRPGIHRYPTLPDLMSLRAYAASRKERGLPGGTHGAVRKAIASKRITLVDGKFDPGVVDYQWARRTEQYAANLPAGARAAADDGGSYADAKLRTERVRAQLLELELAEKNGVLIDAERVRRVTFEKARVARDALMSLPARLSAQLAAETEQMKIHDLLTVEIHRICTELAAGESVKAN